MPVLSLQASAIGFRMIVVGGIKKDIARIAIDVSLFVAPCDKSCAQKWQRADLLTTLRH